MLTAGTRSRLCLAPLLAALAGCSSNATSSDAEVAHDASADAASDTAPPDATDAAAPEAAVDAGLVGARPYHLRVPTGYDAAHPTPLVILLHGYGATGAVQDAYFHLGALAQTRTFLYAYPDGTLDASGKRFWNATDACCNFGNLPVDDVAYVDAILDDVAAHYNVDTHRVFLVGHSNGGFMSHRFACDRAGRIAAIVSLAGANWLDATRCQPTDGVSVLEVHGDADDTIHYGGGPIGDVAGAPQYPSAHDTVATWAARNGCTGALAPTGMTLDLDTSLAGAETRVERYDGCARGAVELWTIQGGGHVPLLQDTWAGTIYDWLLAHARP